MKRIQKSVAMMLCAALGVCGCGEMETDSPANPRRAFVPMFNGEDLSGWTPVNVAAETFTVRDGMIYCTGVPTGVMRSDWMYENFVLEMEWKHLEAGGNAGLFIWADALTAAGVPFSRSVEVQILDGHNTEHYTSHGDVFAIHGAVMTPDRPHPGGPQVMRCLPSERRCLPAGQWNHYRVTCIDGVIKLAVNGKEVSGGTACNPRKGYICLESEGSPVLFRNIRIHELPSSHAGREVTAVSDEGFRSIYTGIDLGGWRVDDGSPAAWRPTDWRLVCLSDDDGPTLWTQRRYRDYQLILDYRRTAEGGSGAVFIGDKSARVLLPEMEERRWQRALITVQSGRARLEVDSKVIAESDVPANGPIGLGAGPIEFANLYVRED